MELRKQLEDELDTRLKIVENKSREIWEKGELYHTYYTLHGMRHSNAVINILNLLVDGLNPEDQLNEIEIFYLLSSAYLHDVGMQCKYPEDEKEVESRSQLSDKTYTLQDLIRDEHHLRSGRYINENYKTLGLNRIEAGFVGLISEGHRKVNLSSTNYDRQPIGLEKVRLRLLAALLRLADELDVDFRRAPEELYKFMKDMPAFSRLQWLKHHYTSGVMIEPIVRGSKRVLYIEINCQYPTEDEGRKITEDLVLKPIEKTMEELKIIFLEYGLKLDLTHKVKLNTNLSKLPEDLSKCYFGKKETPENSFKNPATPTNLNSRIQLFNFKHHLNNKGGTLVSHFSTFQIPKSFLSRFTDRTDPWRLVCSTEISTNLTSPYRL